MFSAGKAKKPQPAARSSTPDQPAPGRGWFAFPAGPFWPLSSPRRRWVTEHLCSRQQLLLLQHRHPQPRLRNADRRFRICATPMTELDFCALQGLRPLPDFQLLPGTGTVGAPRHSLTPARKRRLYGHSQAPVQCTRRSRGPASQYRITAHPLPCEEHRRRFAAEKRRKRAPPST
jgi:hypothetical protein